LANYVTKISVIMSVYNGRAFLAEAVESILAQSYQNFEFIIVDDGSTDSSRRIIDDYSRTDPRIVALDGEHEGLAAALNRGLAIANGDLVARMDADDISAPRRLEMQIRAFASRPALAGLGSAVTTIDDNGSRIRRRTALTGPDRVARELLTSNVLNHPSAMIRKSALDRVGNYRVKFATSQDYDLWLRLLSVGQLDNLPEVLLYYRKHSGRVSRRSNASRQTLYSVTAIADHFLRRTGRPVSDEPLSADAPARLARTLTELLRSELDAKEKKPLLRHAIRFLRHVPTVPENDAALLRLALRGHLGVRDRLKMVLYRV
jgi:glycosyltransferase involved in cell wall biosynthesis